MRRTRTGLVLATALAATLLAPAPAWAGDVQRQEFGTLPSDPWSVLAFDGGEPDITARGGTVTIGAETLVMLLEDETPGDWNGTADRLTGWDVDFRMRLGRDATRPCLDPSGTPSTLLWVGDAQDVLQIGFGPGELCVLYPFEDRETVPLDTTRWHRFHLEARGQHIRLEVDGRAVIDRELRGRGGGSIALGFEAHQGSSTWDYLRYDTAPGHRCTLRGTPGPDDLRGTPGPDVICAGAGDDRVRGMGGDDVLIGGDGDDTLLGGPGHDLLQGGSGDDVLDNGLDSGRAEGGGGDDRFTTGATPDGAHQLVGGAGHDVADYSDRTGAVTVTVDGNGGDGAPGEGDAVGRATPWGVVDVEEVRGGHGDDVLTGSPLRETLVGGPGADQLRGGDGSDRLLGLDGVEGNDRLDGGSGADTCTFDPVDAVASCNDSSVPTPRPTFTMPPYPTDPSSPTPTPAPPVPSGSPWAPTPSTAPEPQPSGTPWPQPSGSPWPTSQVTSGSLWVQASRPS